MIKVNDAGMIRITWFDPASGGGAAIKSFEVQIKNAAGRFVTPRNDCRAGTADIKESTDPASQSPIHLCRIDMSTMVDEFGLGYDSSVVARVRALNSAGLLGEWGQSDSSAKVKTRPAKVPSIP